MSSERQIEANRQNAQRSNGPRSADGKARVALNALTHGLTAKQAVSPDENAKDFEVFQRGLLSALDPHDELEGALAERIVIDAWRLRRVARLESAIYRRGHQESIIKKQEDEVRRYEYPDMDRLMEMDLRRAKMGKADRQAHAHASAKLKESRSALDDASVRMTMVFERYSGTFEQLSRHEAALYRSFFRNLHELQRLQAMRAGERVTPPAVVDVDINVRQKGIGQDGAANPDEILQNKPI